MRRFLKPFRFLTAALALYSASGNAETSDRCVADLSRVDQGFCLAERHTGDDGLAYSWKLKADGFGLTSKVCLTDGPAGSRRDLVLAIDRSQNTWEGDTGRKKLGLDNLTLAKRVIETLRRECHDNPSEDPRVGLILFSSKPGCHAWDGGPITVDRTFPCVYVEAAPISNQQHAARLLDLIKAAEGLYSQGGMASTSQYEIVADAFQKDLFGLSGTEAGLMLFSDGRTYQGAGQDPYDYLRSEAYRSSQNESLEAFEQASGLFQMVFALTPHKSPVFDLTHRDQLENLCALPGATPVDCDDPVRFDDPSTWTVNTLDIRGFARKLVHASGVSDDGLVVVNDVASIDAALATLRYTGNALPLEAVEWSVDGKNFVSGSVNGSRINLSGIAAEPNMSLNLRIKAGGSLFQIPLQVATTRIEDDGLAFQDNEMVCKEGLRPKTEGPLSLDDLQGGSASCGVIGGKPLMPIAWIWLFALPVLIAGRSFLSRWWPFAFACVFLPTLWASEQAEAKEGAGLNALHYQPAVGGVGLVESAWPTPAGTARAGLFVDYANDAVEIGGEKGKRVQSVMDDLVTANAAFAVGLFDKFSLGLNVPYIQKTDLDRSLEGDSQEGGQLGQPGDVIVHAKIQLYRSGTMGFALIPIATAPTGNPELLTGDGTANFGALAAISDWAGRLSWTVNAGYLQRSEPLKLQDDRTRDVIVRGQGIIRSGAEYWMTNELAFAGNLQWKISAGEGLDFTRSSPAEWTASARYRPIEGLHLQSGFGTGIGKGYGSPDYRVWAGISYVQTPKASAPRRSVARR